MNRHAMKPTCHICGRTAASDPCPVCGLLLKRAVAIIPVADEDHSCVIPGKALWYTEERAKDIFKGTPALPIILAARRARMPVSDIIGCQLPLPDIN